MEANEIGIGKRVQKALARLMVAGWMACTERRVVEWESGGFSGN